MSYHHGDLRRAVLTAAVEAINEQGPAGLTLRDLARRAGVSHAAPVYHFKDKAGLLTALAIEGWERLADTLAEQDGDLLESGVAYVRFAVEHRAHFEVMFRPDLYRPDDPAVVTARDRAGGYLAGGVESVGAEGELAGIAAWSIVHGFATLWLTGALPPTLGDDLDAAARSVARMLFNPAGPSGMAGVRKT